MVLSLNRSLYLILLVLFSFLANAQEDENYDKFQDRKDSEKDYLDKEEFKKYSRRAVQVAAWQIQNLKFGALVVRLQNQKRQIEAYKKVGNEKAMLQTIARTEYFNSLIMRSYKTYFTFCKVYFIYGQSSDSLLKGVKQGVFVDSTMKVNPAIVMNENYYIIAEPDYVYNSTIGFVPEDSARIVIESGAQTISAPIVLKNKYGHQLKPPFPYYTNKIKVFTYEPLNAKWPVEISEGVYKEVKIEYGKKFSSKVLDFHVDNMNASINEFYQRYAGLQLKDPKLKPFLY